MRQNNRYFLMGLLGLLTALATVVNNMYSPAMPAVALSLGTGSELGLSASMLGLALGQLVFGPLSDRLGRRRPLLVAMLLLVVAGVAASAATSLSALVALRLVQGIAAGGGVVIARSVAADCARERALIRLLAVVNVVNGLMPIVAPMAGGALADYWGWRSVLLAMAAVGLLLGAGCLLMGETLPAAARTAHTEHRNWWADLRAVLHNKVYVLAVLHQGCALAILFGNLAATPFLAQSAGLDAGQSGLLLGMNGIFTAVGAGSAAAVATSRRGVVISGVGVVVCALVVAAGLLLADNAAPHLVLSLYEVGICASLLFVGLTLTSSTVMALESARSQAGMASALLGAVGFVAGGVVAPLVAGGPTSAAWVVLVAAVMAALLARAATACERFS